MALDEIDAVDLQALEGLVDGALGAGRREVIAVAVAANLGREDEGGPVELAVGGCRPKGVPEGGFGLSFAVLLVLRGGGGGEGERVGVGVFGMQGHVQRYSQ